MNAMEMLIDTPFLWNNMTNVSMDTGYTWHMDPDASKAPPVSCSEYIDNMSVFLDGFNIKVEKKNITKEERIHAGISYGISNIAVPVMCVFGILGNLLNLIVLTRKQIKSTMDCLEKSAHLGLVALAVSDALFCMLYLPTSMLLNDKLVYTHHDNVLTLYYNIYYEAMTNVLLLSSTWLTVIMALARYIAICHPFRARGFINLSGTRAAICCVYILSILLNLPRFWHYYSIRMPCDLLEPPPSSDCACYYYTKATGSLYQQRSFEVGYGVGYIIMGLIIPLVMLTFCNMCLIRALRQSYQMQRMYRANTPRDSGHRITPTLITIIILFTILVTPSEILGFFKDHIITKKNLRHLYIFYSANEIANFLLLTNFSINFVLYCVINVQFRKVVRNIVCCSWRQKQLTVEYFKTNTINNTTVCNVSDMETEV